MEGELSCSVSAGKTVVDQEFGMKLIVERDALAPRVGDAAPEFELERADRSGTLSLQGQVRDKPLVLVFGSFT